jgi:hypothetical protein
VSFYDCIRVLLVLLASELFIILFIILLNVHHLLSRVFFFCQTMRIISITSFSFFLKKFKALLVLHIDKRISFATFLSLFSLSIAQRLLSCLFKCQQQHEHTENFSLTCFLFHYVVLLFCKLFCLFVI